MATSGTTMTIARHGFVPARSPEEIVLAPTVSTVQTSQEGNMLLTAAGMAHLPPSVGVAFAKGARQSGGGGGLIGGLVAAGVSSAVTAASNRRQVKASGPAEVPPAMQAALKRRKAFAASYADVVSLRYKDSWCFRRWTP